MKTPSIFMYIDTALAMTIIGHQFCGRVSKNWETWLK